MFLTCPEVESAQCAEQTVVFGEFLLIDPQRRLATGVVYQNQCVGRPPDVAAVRETHFIDTIDRKPRAVGD